MQGLLTAQLLAVLARHALKEGCRLRACSSARSPHKLIMHFEDGGLIDSQRPSLTICIVCTYMHASTIMHLRLIK